ncbi:MAG: glycosyltransferase [Anaerolineales bacterium]|nr:glycosyltransferase [Anaerolineales bacterium]
MPASLSVCLIVKNEAAHLPRCLASVQDLGAEVVVVDTGSTDETPAIAAAYGARVLAFAWCDDFSAARNFGLDRARGEWLLVLDADEALEPAAPPAVAQLLRDETTAAYEVRVRNFHPPDGAQYTEARSVRLFRNHPAFRFENQIHEQIVNAIRRAGGRIAPSSLLVAHYGYLQAVVQGTDSRPERNLRLLEHAVRAEPENAFLCAKLGLTYLAAGQAGPAAEPLTRALRLHARDPRVLNEPTAGQVRAALQSLARARAEATLQSLLAAADLAGELARRRSELDQALLDLIHENARAAQAAGEAELAEGLVGLAGYVATLAGARRQPAPVV